MAGAKAAPAGAVVIGALLAAPTGTGADSATRIVDRTVVCQMVGTGHPDPVRVMNVSAAPRLSPYAPSLGVYNGAAPNGVSASMQTGPNEFSPGPGRLSLSRTRCRATSIRVPLAGAGLRGVDTALGSRYRCDVPARVLIRVRAVFKRPVTLARDRDFFFARGNIATGTLAVATAAGRRPFVFASVHDEPGTARLFVARRGCVSNQ